MRRRTLVITVLLLAVFGVGGWLLVSRLAGPKSPASKEAAKFAFTISGVRVSSLTDKGTPEDAQPAAEAARDLLTDFYQAAFLDPERWDGGTFPDAFEAFDENAAPAARRDLAALTLGEDATKLTSVKPSATRLFVSVLLDRDDAPADLIAVVGFSATGRASGGGTAPIENEAHFVMQVQGDDWKVVSYRATTTVGGRSQSAASPEPGSSP